MKDEVRAFELDFPEEAAILASLMQERAKQRMPDGWEGGPMRIEPMYFETPKFPRNEPCPCGSKDRNGKPIKFKKCCGA